MYFQKLGSVPFFIEYEVRPGHLKKAIQQGRPPSYIGNDPSDLSFSEGCNRYGFFCVNIWHTHFRGGLCKIYFWQDVSRRGAVQSYYTIVPLTPKRRSFPNSHALTDWLIRTLAEMLTIRWYHCLLVRLLAPQCALLQEDIRTYKGLVKNVLISFC